ncbi:hypothetical protein RDABS01_032082 [Bienertia sinuspersici]
MKMTKTVQASNPVTTDTSEDVDIEPLSGKPFFHVTICKSHISSPYQLVVGAEVTRLLPHKNVPVILTRGSRNWAATYVGTHPTHKRFDFSSWKEFAADNSLKVGDVCLFELLSRTDTNILFKVQVLRGDIPSTLLDLEDGSADNPVVVE